MNFKWKLRLLIAFNHAAALTGIIFLENPRAWLLLPAGVLLIGKLGGEAGFHRYFAHKSFELNGFWKKVVLGLGCLNGIGSPISWAISHRAHHRYSDSEKDPHGKMPGYRIWLTLWRPASLKKTQMSDFIQDETAVWYHRNYYKFYFLTYLLLGMVHWTLPVFLISWSSVITFHSAGLVNVFCHGWGYKNHPTADSSTNNLWVNSLTLGSGLHNNHHNAPDAWDNSEHWYELDLVALMIRMIMVRRQLSSASASSE